MKQVRSNNLTEKVNFQKPTQVNDGQGGIEKGWSDEFTARANYKYLRGNEKVMAGRLAGVQTVVIAVRSFEKSRLVDSSWRVLDARDGIVFNVRTATVTDDRKYIEFLCESGVAT